MKKAPLLILFCLFSFLTYSQQAFTTLVFEDDFNGEGLPDPSVWKYEEGYVRNGEKQYYTVARPENCYMKDGYLHLVIRNDSTFINGEIRPVTSASIHTQGKNEWKYCKVEVRAKLPASPGTWPAIWMMPAGNVYGDWPDSGEIDILEHVGYEPDKIHYAIHSDKYNHMKDNQKNHSVACPTCHTDFHIYGLEWHKDRIEWYLDGVKQFSVDKTEDGWEAWPYDQPFYLILNAAFGGGWGGREGIDLTRLPQTYIIDYVRIYQ
ncbi:MAG: glycoside hydrolase family 16 protein [Candidatus Azobacteroides sp.]|nr:glycoside hydrolase family 16 protein [Candidatus Azobacteroides sp.]